MLNRKQLARIAGIGLWGWTMGVMAAPLLSEALLGLMELRVREALGLSESDVAARLEIRYGETYKGVPPCEPTQLEIFVPPGLPVKDRALMGVKCNGPEKAWLQYVPIRVNLEKPVWVAKKYLPVGTVVDEGDFQLKTVNVLMLQDHLDKPDWWASSPAGLILRRVVRAGQAVALQDFQTTSVIKKGQAVDVLWAKGALSVSMRAKALQEGRAGDLIKLENLQTKRVIQARVLVDGRATMCGV